MKASQSPWDDKAKARLAKAIISGKDDDDDELATSKGSTMGVRGGAVDGGSSEAFEGAHDGHIRIEAADNGVMIKHERRVKTAPSKQGNQGRDVSPNYEHKTVAKVFAKNDHDGMADHIMSILKSPMQKSGGIY